MVFAIWLRELKLGLCESLEGWEGGDTCIPMADLCCCMAEANTILWNNFLQLKINHIVHFWTLWEKVRVGWCDRIALKHVYYHTWNRSPVQVQCMKRHTKLVHWDNPEGWDGKGDGRGVQDGEHMYTHGWFMSMYGKNHYTIVISLQLK